MYLWLEEPSDYLVSGLSSQSSTACALCRVSEEQSSGGASRGSSTGWDQLSAGPEVHKGQEHGGIVSFDCILFSMAEIPMYSISWA